MSARIGSSEWTCSRRDMHTANECHRKEQKYLIRQAEWCNRPTHSQGASEDLLVFRFSQRYNIAWSLKPWHVYHYWYPSHCVVRRGLNKKNGSAEPWPAQRSSLCGTSPSRIVLSPSVLPKVVVQWLATVGRWKGLGVLSESFSGDWRKPVRSLVFWTGCSQQRAAAARPTERESENPGFDS